MDFSSQQSSGHYIIISTYSSVTPQLSNNKLLTSSRPQYFSPLNYLKIFNIIKSKISKRSDYKIKPHVLIPLRGNFWHREIKTRLL